MANADDWENIPIELQAIPQWMVCQGIGNKQPLTLSGYPGDPTDSNNWRTFQDACAVAEAYGWCIGFCLSDRDPFTIIDMDNKSQNPYYQQQINQTLDHFDTYIERSLSGLGYHAVLLGDIGGGRKLAPFELYSRQRFMIMTGDVLSDKRRPISAAYQKELQLFAEQCGPASEYEQVAIDWTSPPTDEEKEIDHRCLQWFATFKNVAKIERCFEGWDFADPTYNRRSEDDAFLMQLYYKFNGWRPEQREKATIRMFLRSPRARYVTRHNDWQQYVARTYVKAKTWIDREETQINGLQGAVNGFVNGQALQNGHSPSGADIGRHPAAPAASNILNFPSPFRAPQKEFEFFNVEILLDQPPVQWVVKDMFEHEAVGIIYGWAGISKTFLIIDMMEAIATGRIWMGQMTTRMPVAYIGLEGMRGFGQRIAGWEKHNGRLYPRDMIGFCRGNFNLVQDHVAMAQALGKFQGFIVIDTLAQAISGTDENSFKEMSRVYDALQNIRDATQSAVCVVHHSTKPDKTGDHGHLPRGHGSLYANFACAMEVDGDEESEQRVWRAKRVKEGESGYERHYQLVNIDLGNGYTSRAIQMSDPWEREQNVATVGRSEGWKSGKQADDAIKRTADRNCSMTPQQAIKQAIVQLGAETNTFGKYGSGDGTPCAPETQVVTRAIELRNYAVANQGKKDVKREVENMKANGKLGYHQAGNIVWLWVPPK